MLEQQQMDFFPKTFGTVSFPKLLGFLIHPATRKKQKNKSHQSQETQVSHGA
jgi:hypothetical protein